MMDNFLYSLKREEKKKYTEGWISGRVNNSRSAIPLFRFVKRFNKKWKMLDIGCGNGLTVSLLRKYNFNVFGEDITLEGLKLRYPIKRFKNKNFRADINPKHFFKAPVWDLPFKDNEFDFVFSTDVLEHVPPELIQKAISEIYRVTKIKTFHSIALFKDSRYGLNFHLTIQPIEWWRKQFENLNIKGINTCIADRVSFLKKYNRT